MTKFDISEAIRKFTSCDSTYNTQDSKYTQFFNEFKEICIRENYNFLYTGKVYRVHQQPVFYKKGIKKGKLKIKENKIKPTKNKYSHWSKNSKIYDYLFSDSSGPNPCVHEPFLFIIGNVKNGIDANKVYTDCYNYPLELHVWKEEEIIAPLNNENIEKIILVYDRNNKDKQIDVTDLLLSK